MIDNNIDAEYDEIVKICCPLLENEIENFLKKEEEKIKFVEKWEAAITAAGLEIENITIKRRK